MKKLFGHLKTFIFRGFLAIIPLVLSYFVIRFLHLTIDKQIMDVGYRFIGFRIPGLGIFILLIILYFMGIIASNVTGRQFFNLVERLTGRIPIIRSTYQIGKQLSVTLALPEKQVFKKAVLVNFLKPGIWTVGFITGSIVDKKNNNEILLKVFVPTPPMPTSGTMVLVKKEEVRDPGWTIDEALKAVISGGIIGPEEIR
jgi:uncharacterized membrane protein